MNNGMRYKCNSYRKHHKASAGVQVASGALLFRGVAQMVARVLWEHEAAGSIPVTPILYEVILLELIDKLAELKSHYEQWPSRNAAAISTLSITIQALTDMRAALHFDDCCSICKYNIGGGDHCAHCDNHNSEFDYYKEAAE